MKQMDCMRNLVLLWLAPGVAGYIRNSRAASKPCLCIYSTRLQGTEVTVLEDMSCSERPVPGCLGVIAE